VLYVATARLPNGRPLPALFDFTPEELRGVSPEMRAKLVPPHYQAGGGGGGTGSREAA